MTVGRLALRELADDEVAGFLERQERDYAADIERNGGWSADDARAKARRELAEMFPGGRVPAGHHLLHLVEAASGEAVGVLWYREDERGLWLYQVTIAPERRGQGLGREAMKLLDGEARRLGAARIELNVFGGNDAARSLYRSLGYREDAVVMSKPVPTD